MTLSLKARKLLQPGPVRVDEEVHMHVGQTHTDIIYIWIPYMGKDIKFDLCKSWEASWSWTFSVWIRWFCRSACCRGTNCETGCILLLIWSQCFSLAKPVTHRLGGSVHSPQILFQHQLPKYEQDHNECGKDLPHLEFCGGGKVWLVFFPWCGLWSPSMPPGCYGAIAPEVPPGLGSRAVNPHHPSPWKDRYITGYPYN